jgi:splicing factor 45
MISTAGRFEEDYGGPHDPRDLALGVPHPPPVAVNIDMSGDDAYQRRLAMSTSFQSATSSQSHDLQERTTPYTAHLPQSIPETPSAIEDEQNPFATSVLREETGEEAYLRRLALSQRKPMAAPNRLPTPEPPALAYNPFAPPTHVPPPSAAGLPPSGVVLSDEKVKNSRAAAAAIAAKLASLAPPVAPTTSSSGGDLPAEDISAAPEGPRCVNTNGSTANFAHSLVGEIKKGLLLVSWPSGVIRRDRVSVQMEVV